MYSSIKNNPTTAIEENIAYLIILQINNCKMGNKTK